jgi:hypothetical protein
MRVIAILILVLFFSSCVKNKNGVGVQENLPANSNKFVVTEVIQASNYTYLKVKEKLAERWVAVSKQEIKFGDIFYYDGAMQMNNFASKDLNRTFDEIYFISEISKTPIAKKAMGGNMPAHSGKTETKKLSDTTINKEPGEITIAEIFAKRVDISGVFHIKLAKSVKTFLLLAGGFKIVFTKSFFFNAEQGFCLKKTKILWKFKRELWKNDFQLIIISKKNALRKAGHTFLINYFNPLFTKMFFYFLS